MSVAWWQSSASVAPEPVDRVVIGAGLIGAYLAWCLADAPGQTLVLDARHVAGGASGRNGGLLLTGVAHSYQAACARYGRADTRTLWSYTLRNRERMIELAAHFATPVRRCGSLILACSAAEAAELEASAVLLHDDGFPAQFHAKDPLQRGFVAALENNADGAIHPALLTAALLKASGAIVQEAQEVYALESLDDGVLVRYRGGAVLAQQVLLATNAWTPLLLPEFEALVVPGRGQVFVTAPAPQVLQHAAYCDYGFIYFQQLPDGRFVLGGGRNRAFEAEQTYADTITPFIQAELFSFLNHYFPELAAVPVERRWSGTMAFTPDGLPLVGRLRRDPRVAFAVGFNGHGLGLGVVAADELLAELNDQVPAQLFSARRVGSWVL